MGRRQKAAGRSEDRPVHPTNWWTISSESRSEAAVTIDYCASFVSSRIMVPAFPFAVMVYEVPTSS